MRFAFLFGVVVGGFYLLYVPVSQSSVYGSYLGAIAKVSAAVLRTLGQDATVSGQTIIAPAFSARIVAGCDGMEMVALFVAAVLSFPVPWRSRIPFMVVGVGILLVVNVIRIVSLFCVGVYFPAATDMVHWDAWPGVLVVAVLSCWLVWAWRAAQPRRAQAHVSP